MVLAVTVVDTVSIVSMITLALITLLGGGGALGWRSAQHKAREREARQAKRDVLRNARLDELIKHNGDLRSELQALRSRMQHLDDIGSTNLAGHLKEIRDEFRSVWEAVRELQRHAKP